MAGALTISTLNNDTGVLATQNGMTGIAKAWVNFNGTNGTVNGSFNVSSVTVVSSGTYTINLTSAMPNANYCAQVANQQNSTTNTSSNLVQSLTTTSMAILHFESGSLVNPFANSAIFLVVFSS